VVNRWGAVVLVAAVVAASFGLVPAVPAAEAPGAEPNAVVAAADSNRLLYVTEGNRLRRIDVDTIGTDTLVEDVLIERAASDPDGRDINGQMCELPGTGGRFVAGEDTGQPDPPAGWGVFEGDGTQVGKLTASYFEEGAEPHGCAVAPDGTLFTAEVGFQGFGTNNGQLIEWFRPTTGTPDRRAHIRQRTSARRASASSRPISAPPVVSPSTRRGGSTSPSRRACGSTGSPRRSPPGPTRPEGAEASTAPAHRLRRR
jgi:hypothetical protein